MHFPALKMNSAGTDLEMLARNSEDTSPSPPKPAPDRQNERFSTLSEKPGPPSTVKLEAAAWALAATAVFTICEGSFGTLFIYLFIYLSTEGTGQGPRFSCQVVVSKPQMVATETVVL